MAAGSGPVEGLAPLPVGEAYEGEITRASCLSEADAPGRNSAPPINLLTSVADGRASGAIPPRWQGGVCWEPVGCNPVCVWPDDCDPCADQIDAPDEKPVFSSSCATAYSFDLTTGKRDDCKRRTADELIAQSSADLAALTPAGVANYLSVAVCKSAETLPGGKAVPVETAIGMLFNARAARGAGGGTLMIPDIAVGAVQDSGLLTRSGARYTSLFGSSVVVGPGFQNLVSGECTVETEPGKAWLYVTGPVDYAVDDVELVSNQVSWDAARRNQIREVVMERSAIVRFDPCNVFAVCVELPKTSPCVEGGEG